MSFFDALRYRLRALGRPGARETEMADEMRHHLDLEASGSGDAIDGEARLAARRRFGNVTYSVEERRRISGAATLDSMRQDVRFVARLLRRRAGFATVTIATIALGVAAATSIFSVADAVLFRPLAFPRANELTTVWLTRSYWKKIPGLVKRWDHGTLSMPAFRQWRRGQTSFTDVAAWESMSAIVGGDAAPEEMLIGRATASLFPILAIRPEIGAWFSEADDAADGPHVAVVSHETWAVMFGGDPRILGRIVDINGARYTIVGVAPRGFSLDRGPATIAFWLPAAQDTVNANDNGSFNFQAIGRLDPRASLKSASVEAARLLRDGSTDDRIDGTLVSPLHADQTRAVRGPLLMLLTASGLLLLIACINVATLLMGEAVGREHELRTRTALGAGRGRLLRQLLTESVLLAGIGGALGAAIAAGATRLIVRAAPPTIPGLGEVSVDGRVLGVSLVAAVATGVLFGLVPAFSLIRSGARNPMTTTRASLRGRERAQRTFIVCEVALSMVLLVAAGLLVRSFSKLSSVGFEPSNLFIATLKFPRASFADSIHARSIIADVERNLRTLPGVIAVGTTTTPPFTTGSSSTSFEVEGRPVSTQSPGPTASRRATTPAFFATAGIPLVAGRFYTDDDRAGTPLVVVVSHDLAAREWPGESAVGQRIKIMGATRTVIGVAGDIETERPTGDFPETVYTPLAQLMLRGSPSIVIRVRSDAQTLVPELRQAVRAVESDVSVSRVDSMRGLVDEALADDRLRTVLISLFAGIAAILAAIGTYGVASTAAQRRTREMAIRVAVGASSGSIVRLIVGGAVRAVVIGAAIGVGLAVFGSRVLAPYLYGIGIADPEVYSVVALLLALTTLAAAWFPARRATRVPLVETLAAE